jgi:hypothetical protein
MNRKKLATYVLKLGLTIGIIWALLHFVGWSSVLSDLQEVDLSLILLSWAFALVGHYIESVQVRRLEAGRYACGCPSSLLANSLSALYGLVLPGELLAASPSGPISRRSSARSPGSSTPWCTTGSCCCCHGCGGLLALAVHNPFSSNALAVSMALASAATLSLVFVLYHPYTGARLNGFLRRTSARWLPGGVAGKVTLVLDSMEPFYAFSWTFHLDMFLRASLVLGLAVVKFIITASAAGISVSVLALVWVLAVIKLVGQFPISLQGLGVREGILIATLSLYSVPAEKAFTLGILMFSSVLVFALVGLGYQICLTLGLVRWGAARTDLNDG